VSFAGSAARAVRPLERSLICLNPEHSWKVGFDGNLDVYDLRYTLKHEIGHAIGLDHPGTTSAVMSYRYEERFRQLQPGDIRGAVALYGSRQKLMAETPDRSRQVPRAAAGRRGPRTSSSRTHSARCATERQRIACRHSGRISNSAMFRGAGTGPPPITIGKFAERRNMVEAAMTLCEWAA
jgi:hypothetical protein